jgi:Big-like domain-containing protein/VCBS repeat protein/fibronectin type III domain protein
MARLRWVVGTVALLVLVGAAPAIAAPPGSAAPTGLRTTSVAATSVGLAWNAVPGATGYEVLRGTPTTALSVVGTSARTAYSDTGLAAGRTYVYAVATLSKKGASPESVPLTVVTVPAAPTGLIAAALSSTSVSLSWSAPEGATGYEVWRATPTNTPLRVMVLSGSTSGGITVPPPTAWTDTKVQALGTYTYTVRATNVSGTSPDSVPATVTTPPPAKTATTTTLSSGKNPSSAGDQVTFTAIVTAPQGTAVPTGTVSFAYGSSGATVTLNPNGVAWWTTTTAVAGTFLASAKYSGSTTYAASSGSVTQTVQAITSVFAPYVAYPTGSWPASVVAADVNGDGRAEAVLATTFYFDTAHDYKLYVYDFVPGQAGPTVTVLPTALVYSDDAPMVTADMDRDGYPDVLLGTSSGVQVFHGSAQGLRAGTVYPTAAEVTGLAVADLDNDGITDVVAAQRDDSGAGSVAVLHGSGGGALGAQHVVSTAQQGQLVAAGDVTGDGRPDLVVVSYTRLQVYVDGSTTGGTPGDLSVWADQSLPAGTYTTEDVDVADVTGDHVGDVLVSGGILNPAREVLLVVPGATPGTAPGLGATVEYRTPGPIEDIVATDVNGDGRADVVDGHGGWNELGLFLQSSGGGLQAEQIYPLPYASHYPPFSTAVGDVTGDGRPDVLIADYNNGLVLLRGR